LPRIDVSKKVDVNSFCADYNDYIGMQKSCKIRQLFCFLKNQIVTLTSKENVSTNYEANTTIVITFIAQCVIWVIIKIGKIVEFNRIN